MFRWIFLFMMTHVLRYNFAWLTPSMCDADWDFFLLVGISDDLAHALSHSNAKLLVTSQVLIEVTRKAVEKCPNIKVHTHIQRQTHIHRQTYTKLRLGHWHPHKQIYTFTYTYTQRVYMVVLKHLFVLKQNIYRYFINNLECCIFCWWHF